MSNHQVAPSAVTLAGLDTLNKLPCNVIARLSVTAGPATARDLLRRFRVAVPNEAHMLVAAHAIRGTFVLTLNFDDGIETAYALLEGRTRLPCDAPQEFHRALKAWRTVLRPTAPLLIVASRFSTAQYRHRPVLVKLRGSHLEGWHRSLVPLSPTRRVERRRFSASQTLAMRVAASAEHFAVTGFSGADVDCRRALMGFLRTGHFSWTAAELSADIVARVRRIDVRQPILRPAVEGVRASLPHAGELPPWPKIPTGYPGFECQFAQWQSALPAAAAAEVYAQILAEAGILDEAGAIRSALRLRAATPN